MEDLGAPISYAVLETGTPVLSSDGERIGEVTHVLAAEAQDIFDGLVVGSHHLGGPSHRFVDAPEVAAIHERGVTLTIDAAACAELPEPSENPTEVVIDADGTVSGSGVAGKLRRAWNLLSGNY